MNNNNNNNTANSNNNNNSSNLNAPPSVPGVGANFSNNGFNSNQINLASSAAVSQLQALGMASAASMLTDSLFSHSQASNLSGSQQQQQQQAPVSVNELTAQTHTLTSSSSMPMSSSQHGSTASASASASASDKMDTSGPLGSSLNGGCNLNGLNCNSFGSFGSCSNSSGTAVFVGDVISRLYPNVNQQETPLPRYWSTIHKCQTLALTNNNLRVTYKGPGKTHKDAASVRTDYPIPAACGIYYFEVKIVSKGRDGYMGIGLSKSDVLLSRLPGWDKNSYGYHGDDGHSFCCSGTGQNYGPTFTTGDVIGCCLNLIENTCFYTKNGYNLGIAFRDLPSDLYPTVGLQTPSESVEANFGQYPFEFDVHNYVKEWHLKTRQTIERYPLKKENENNLPITLRKLISTYLVHHGYSATAEAFAKSVGGVFEEELASIRNRQKIQKQVLNGQLAEAIELTYQLFPGILERNPNLLFALKVRQFIEMIYSVNPKPPSSSSSTSHQITAATAAATSTGPPLSSSSLLSSASSSNFVTTTEPPAEFVNSKKTPGGLAQSSSSTDGGADMKDSSAMIVDQDSATTSKHLNGNGLNDSGNGYVISKNGDTPSSEEQMDMDSPSSSFSRSAGKRDVAKNSPSFDNQYLQTILDFGRDLFQMNTRTNLEHGDNPGNTKMLRDAFSLLAYHDPWTSPLGYQLDPSQREPISAMLNSAILEANNMPRIPPLEVVYGQTSECMRLMSKYGVAWCAYVNLTDYMQS